MNTLSIYSFANPIYFHKEPKNRKEKIRARKDEKGYTHPWLKLHCLPCRNMSWFFETFSLSTLCTIFWFPHNLMIGGPRPFGKRHHRSKSRSHPDLQYGTSCLLSPTCTDVTSDCCRLVLSVVIILRLVIKFFLSCAYARCMGSVCLLFGSHILAYISSLFVGGLAVCQYPLCVSKELRYMCPSSCLVHLTWT